MGAPISFELAAHALTFRAKMTETKISRGANMTIGSKNKFSTYDEVQIWDLVPIGAGLLKRSQKGSNFAFKSQISFRCVLRWKLTMEKDVF